MKTGDFLYRNWTMQNLICDDSVTDAVSEDAQAEAGVVTTA
jgi:hypothetical protein